ncbi:MAG: hypothetical protein QNK03_18160 [Myxococcota bacterium]|nr:hypothetical protein [Myxococcota bacterium]
MTSRALVLTLVLLSTALSLQGARAQLACELPPAAVAEVTIPVLDSRSKDAVYALTHDPVFEDWAQASLSVLQMRLAGQPPTALEGQLMGALTRQVRSASPALDDVEPAQRPAVIEAALRDSPELMEGFAAVVADVHGTLPETQGPEPILMTCQGACIVVYDAATADAWAAFLAGLDTCAWVQSAAACYLDAVDDLVTALERAEDEYADCMMDCDGSECLSDDDCARDEYCDQGWLTIGRNECHFKYIDGFPCSRPAQCESNCCKYAPLVNALSFTCRPTDKCN